MLIRKPNDIPSSEITPETAYWNRRYFMAAAAAFGTAAVAGRRLLDPSVSVEAATKLQTVKSPLSTIGVAPTSFQDSPTYHNYYDFGTGKGDPSANAQHLKMSPWSIKVEGLVQKPRTVSIDDLIRYRPLEERVYRFRCVEGWSMVVPWAGYSLAEFIKFCQPLSSARYVQFLSLYDHAQMPELSASPLESAYSEGLRMDEAMNPLTLLTFGLYGQTLPPQDGGPVRIIVPWKYGFKSAKAIVTIRFTDRQPPTTWSELNPSAYGFYSNVNPSAAPWISQAAERVIGAPIWKQRQPTLMFNGYGDLVASLYKGMDLDKFY